jgi:hypothetical protein
MMTISTTEIPLLRSRDGYRRGRRARRPNLLSPFPTSVMRATTHGLSFRIEAVSLFDRS